MSGCVAGGTEMSSADFLYFQIFSSLILEKGSPHWGQIYRFFCKWACFLFFSPNSTGDWLPVWDGNMAELLTLKKEIPSEAHV